MDCSPPGSSVHVILQARILEWVAISFSRRSSWPRDQICISCSAGRFFTPEPPERPHFMGTTSLMLTVTTRNRYCHLCSAEDNRTEALTWIIHLLCTSLHSNLSFNAHKEPMMWTLPVSWCDRWRNWGTESEQLSNIMHTARGWLQMLTQSPLSPKPPAPGSSGSVHLWEELQQQMRGDQSWAAQIWSPPTHKPTHKSNWGPSQVS